MNIENEATTLTKRLGIQKIKQPDGSIAVYKHGKLALYMEEDAHASEQALERMANKLINDFNTYMKNDNIL